MTYLEKLYKKLEDLETDKFAFYCNDQFDICDEFDKDIDEVKKEIEKIEKFSE